MQLKFLQLASLALAACSLAVSTTSAQTCTFDYKELECAPSKSCSLQYKFGDLSPAQACRAITTTVDANKVPQQSHLAFAGAVAGTGMTVSWTTRTKVTDPQVWIGTSQTSLSLASAVIETKSYYSDSSYSLFTYHATLSGLTPASKYFYKVGSASSVSFQSDVASFVTAKPAGSKDAFEIAIYGDFGVDANAVASNKFVNALNGKVDFVYHVGDISYADNAFLTVSEFVGFYYEETYNRWMSSLTALMRQAPYMVLVGNHEAECHSPSCLISSSKKDQLGNYTAFNARFKMPSAESNGVKNMWYSFDYASVHFTTMSSETDYTDAPSNSYTLRKHGNFGNQLAWLEADLKKADANRANVPWLIVGMHRAMYTIRSQSSGVPNDEALPVQKAFEELFIKYKVDMVISGHVHAYERHLPIARSKAVLDGVSADRKTYASPKAPVYVISGASGSSEGHNDYKGVTSPWNAKFDDTNYGVSQLKATPTALSWKFVASETGAVLDEFVISKERTTAIRSRAPQLWPRSRALWDGVLQLALVLVSLALLVASSQGNEASSLLRGPTNAHVTNYRETQFTSALVASHAGLQTHRRLANTTTNSTIDDATEKAKEIGASVRNAIKQLRGGSDKFYKDLITAAKIVICQHKVDNPGTGVNPSNRYVNETDDLAYKNSTGGCIRITITAMSDDDMVAKYKDPNACEVEPNCYWSTIDTAVDTDRTMQPADGSMTYSDAKDELKKWGQGVLVFIVPGIILAVLSLFTMIFFLICRCCCNRCGSRSPKEGGYTCMQKFLPLLFFLLFAVGVVVVAGVSLLYQKTLTDAVDDTFNTTLSTLNDTGAWLVRIRTPLEEIRDKVVDSADEIALQIADTSFIDHGIDGLTGALTKFKDDSADRTLPAGCNVTAGNPYCVACTVCTTISDQVSQANQQIKDNAGKGVTSLKDVRDTLTTSLVKVKNTVRSSVAEHVGDLDTFITTITDTHKNLDDVYGKYDDQKAVQQVGVLVFFGLALVVIVLGLLGILFGLTTLKFLANIIHVAYFIGFLALTLTFIASSIFLAASVVLGDACEMTAIVAQNWTVVVSGQNGDIANACFDVNASLIDALNLTSQLDFARGGIPFPDNIDTDKLLNFSDLDAFAETIKDVDSSTFQVDQTALDKGLEALNKYTKQTDGQCKPVDGNYVEATILTPWDANGGGNTTNDGLTYMIDHYRSFEQLCLAGGPGLPFNCYPAENPCPFQVFIGELYKNVSTLAAVKVDGAAFVTQLHENMAAVTASTQTFKDKAKDLNGKVNVIKEDLEKSLFSYVGDFEKEMTCTFIHDSYLEIYSALCGDLMPAFTMISLMLFLAGIFLIPVTVCLITAVKRLKARGNGSHVMDNEMKFK